MNDAVPLVRSIRQLVLEFYGLHSSVGSSGGILVSVDTLRHDSSRENRAGSEEEVLLTFHDTAIEVLSPL